MPSPCRPSDEKLNVVILYQSMRYVGKAMAAYLHLMRELADDLAPDFHLWRLDVAIEPGCAAEAERDIAAAGVIIVAINGHQPCPPVFQRWRGGQDVRAGLPPCPIIALVEASEGPAPVEGSWNSILRMAATQIHPEVFVWNPPLTREVGFLAAATLAPVGRDGAVRSGTYLSTPNHNHEHHP